MKRIFFGIVSFLTVLSISTYMTGCNRSDPSPAANKSYSGPGSQWNVSLGTDTFVITYAATVGGAVAMTIEGTYEQVTSGYLKLTVTSSTDTINGPSPGDQAYAMNIPGFVFLLKPMGNDGEIIPMIVSGKCPTAVMNFNWMVTSHESNGQGSDLSTGKDLIGTASFNGADTLSIPKKFDLQKNSLTAGDAMAGTCSDGIISLPGDNVNIWLSKSEAALVQVKNGGRDSVIVAMPQDSLNTVSELDGEYIGLLFNEAVDENTQSETQPVWFEMSNGSVTAGSFTDGGVDAGTKDTGGVTITGLVANSPSIGFISGTLTELDSGKTAPMTCQTTKDVNGSGKNLIFCVGIDANSYQSGNKDQLYTVLLVSK